MNDDMEQFHAWRAHLDELAARPLTPEELDSLPDADLDAVAERKAAAIMGSDVTAWRVRIEALSQGQRMIWATQWAAEEVYNGGFHQYFHNSSGAFAPHAYDGFLLIGADEHAEVLNRAMQTFLDEHELHDRIRADGSIEAFVAGYKETRLTELDPMFWELSDRVDLLALRVRYIRGHLTEFADA